MSVRHYEFVPGKAVRLANAHWEHGHRVHGLWCDVSGKRLGAVGIGPTRLWDGKYRWHLDDGRSHTEPSREEATLARAKKATEELLLSRDLAAVAKPASLAKISRLLAANGFLRGKAVTTAIPGWHDRHEGFVVFRGDGRWEQGATKVRWSIGNQGNFTGGNARVAKALRRITRFLLKKGFVVTPSRELGPWRAVLVFEAS